MTPIVELRNELKTGGLKRLHKFISGFKTDAYIPLISEWAQDNRYIPAGLTEFPGYVNHNIAPHLIEIQDCFHPDNPTKQVTVMKGTQALVTTTLENVIGHSIKYKLHNILYIISSKNIAGIRSSMAIDVLIDNSGLKDYVKPISDRVKRKTGDKTFYKEFHGGRRLMMTSWNSIGDAKSLSWDLIIMDELEEAPYELADQGDPEKIFAGRSKTIRRAKIVKISTPTNTHGRIYKNFLEGDQSYYFAQCPMCGELQVLTLYGMGNKFGLRAQSEMVNDHPIIITDTVEYICKFCEGSIKEFQKGAMLLGGKWKPTARPINPDYRSFHVSNLMSPVMFYTWTQCMQEFAETKYGQDITKFKNFKIDVLGEPWEVRENKQDFIALKEIAEDYQLGEIPEGGLILDAGIDVQKGWLAFMCVAWGKDMESWIVDYQMFHGDTSNLKNNSWQALRQYILTKRYTFKNVVRDISVPLTLSVFDTGFNPKKYAKDYHENDTTSNYEHLVYEFVSQLPRAIACRGNDDLKDIILKEMRIHKNTHLKTRFDLAVSELKDETYVKLAYGQDMSGKIHFSKYLPDEFFKGFVSEVYTEISPGKFGWKKVYDRNEPLDTYILCRGGAEYLNLPTWPPIAWDEYRQRIFS